MSYPAFDSFTREIGRDVGADIRRGFSLWRVYMALQPPVLNFVTPQPVKVEAVATELRMGRHTARNSLRWLVSAGYLVEHGERAPWGVNGVRHLVLAWAKQPSGVVTPVVVTVSGALPTG